MPLYFTDRLPPDPNRSVQQTLALTAEERTRSRFYFPTESGEGVYLRLPRGTVLRQGELLRSAEGIYLRVVAKPEPVMVVTANSPLLLLRAAYHLGNRHVSLEVTPAYLQLSPDPVLKTMLEQLGLQVTEAILPFEPEPGAYGSQISQNHSHSSSDHYTLPYHHTHSHDHEHYHGNNPNSGHGSIESIE
ncbi:MAG: urease accessory protein UreE [Elainella sp. Prado103]|nr:urease accessory protein UreE [Elainella sp. Prado103]